MASDVPEHTSMPSLTSLDLPLFWKLATPIVSFNPMDQICTLCSVAVPPGPEYIQHLYYTHGACFASCQTCQRFFGDYEPYYAHCRETQHQPDNAYGAFYLSLAAWDKHILEQQGDHPPKGDSAPVTPNPMDVAPIPSDVAQSSFSAPPSSLTTAESISMEPESDPAPSRQPVDDLLTKLRQRGTVLQVLTAQFASVKRSELVAIALSEYGHTFADEMAREEMEAWLIARKAKDDIDSNTADDAADVDAAYEAYHKQDALYEHKDDEAKMWEDREASKEEVLLKVGRGTRLVSGVAAPLGGVVER